ncbi:tol-pal system protein YbgF [Haematospirillum sp. H1815]|uniref:tol-pal system protein YbgF n=1 Tax=Haematospirillum sp. H1815 TaxID=2723108 RepID=UPI001FD7E3A8|nr:tol-pal system protein YbgF [Haematospirillum sp. H1815]
MTDGAALFSLSVLLRFSCAGCAAMVCLLVSAPAVARDGFASSGIRVAQADSAGLVSELLVKVGELERLNQELTGRLEEVQHENQQLSERFDAYVKDAEFRFQELEKRGGGASPASGSSSEPASGARASAPSEPMDPGQKYTRAFNLLRTNDYPAAQVAFQDFIKENPGHDLAGNAQYWLGETFYVRGNYKQAAVSFLDGYKKYPKSTKAPDNLLKLGLTMGKLGQNKEACAALGKLKAEYPAAPDAIKRRLGSEKERLKCSF